MTLKNDEAKLKHLVGLKDFQIDYPIPEDKEIISDIKKPRRKK